MSSTVSLKAPPTSTRLAEALQRTGRTLLVCPECQTNALSAAMAALLDRTVKSVRLAAVVVTPDAQRVEQRLTELLSAIGIEFENPRAGTIKAGGRIIAIRSPEKKLQLTFAAVDFAVVDQIESLSADRWGELAALLRPTSRTIALCGPSLSSAWYVSLFDDRQVLTYEDALAAGTLTAQQVEEKRKAWSASEFEYRYECKVTSNLLPVPGASLSVRGFARLRLRVRTNDVPAQIVPFDLFPLQRRYLAMKRLGRRHGYRMFILLKYRRGGFTTLEQGESYRHCVRFREARCLTLAHTFPDSVQIFAIARRYHENDPYAPALTGGGSSTQLKFAKTNSQYVVATAGANAPGRGDTLDRVHGSEVSKWGSTDRGRFKVDELMSGLTQAASKGEVTLESTPNGYEWFCQTYKDAKSRKNAYWPIFFRWFDDPNNRATVRIPGMQAQSKIECDPVEVLETLTGEEKEFVKARLLFDPSKLRADDPVSVHRVLTRVAWRRARKLEVGTRLFVQEYPEDDESCFLTSGVCYFDAHRIVELRNALPDYTIDSVPGIIHRNIPGGFETIWEKPIPTERYVMGIDTSEGVVGGDPSGIGVLKESTGEQVYSLHGLFKPDELAGHVERLHKMYNEARFGVEVQNHGHVVLARLADRKLVDRRFCFFYQPGRPGWSTDQVTRPIMLSDLSDILSSAYAETIIRDRLMLSECTTFNRQRDGKYEADSGAHDDCVMKWAIAYAIRKAAKVR
jgi:hypothetical protein